MKLLAGFLGASFALKPFPRAPTDICETSVPQGRSCSDVKSRNPDAKSGIYKIQLPNQRPVVVDCVFEDGNAFTVIQKRTTGVLSFKRSWREYKEGFTSWEERSKYGYRGPRPEACELEEYWIGLDNIRALTSIEKKNYLRIDLQRYNGQTASVSYDDFRIGSESQKYKLESMGLFLNDASINVGNSFEGAGFGNQGYSPRDKFNTNHVGMAFSTYDNDNDMYWGNCADQDSSGWWFNRCSAVNLNGKHYGQDSSAIFQPNKHGFDDGILWQTFTNNKYESLIGSKMMLGSFAQQDHGVIKQDPAMSCQEIADRLYSQGKLSSKTKDGAFDGVYSLNDRKGGAIQTECKIRMGSSANRPSPIGWTLIQKRYDGSVDFNKSWNEYKRGFGFELEKITSFGSRPRPMGVGEGWIGNEFIYEISTRETGGAGIPLLIEMERKFDKTPNNAIVGYENFAIGNEWSEYKLNKIDRFMSLVGNAGDAFLGDDFGKQGFGNDRADTNHKGMKFSTYDRDNDNINEFHCAEEDVSGWWFNACSAANLNGHYYSSGVVDRNTNFNGRKPARGLKEYDDGILWNTWTHDKWESLMTTKMWVSSPGKLQIYRETFGEIEDPNDPIDLDYNEENSESSSSLFDDYNRISSFSRTDDDY